MNEAGSETLTVLYERGGRILALTRQRAEPPAGDEPIMRSGVDAQPGQLAVTLDVDPAWSARSLSELAQHFTVVVDDDGRAQLRPSDVTAP